MVLQDYQKAAFRTNPDLGKVYGTSDDLGLKINLAHMSLGISSEVDEVDAAYTKVAQTRNEKDKFAIKDEVGDVMWYVAGYCTFRNYDMKLIALRADKSVALFQAAFKLNDLTKKFLAYGKPINSDVEQDLLGTVVQSCQIICSQLDIDFAEVLEKNIEKLRVRFPDKFSQEEAINRDTKKEKKVFESKED